jgi:NAD(P)H dehydrogenase (quinone)
MKVQIIHAHPEEGSFNGAIHTRIIEALSCNDHEVADLDLYREEFQPILSRTEWANYHDTTKNTNTVKSYIEGLLWAEALVFCYPTWWHGAPAILKGYLDRVFVPGIAFHLPKNSSQAQPGLTHIRKLGVVTTCGGSWLREAVYMRQAGKGVVLQALKPLLNKKAQCIYLINYSTDKASANTKENFLRKVSLTFSKF